MSKKWSPEPEVNPVDSLLLAMGRLGKKPVRDSHSIFKENLRKYNKSRTYKESLKELPLGKAEDKKIDIEELNEILRFEKKKNRRSKSRYKKKKKKKKKTKKEKKTKNGGAHSINRTKKGELKRKKRKPQRRSLRRKRSASIKGDRHNK